MRTDKTAEVVVLGLSRVVNSVDEALAMVAGIAAKLDRQVEATTKVQGETTGSIVVFPDRTYADAATPDDRHSIADAPDVEHPALATLTDSEAADPVAPSNPWTPTPATSAPPIHVAPEAPRHARRSFITTTPVAEPARQGWRGTLNRFGLRLSPGAEEQQWRSDVQAVSQHWPGPRTIAIANPKGGAGKTPASAVISAVFARYGGAGVLAWDNNETRGTLAWRTEGASHDATVLDLLPQTEQLLSTTAQSAEMSFFTHHQPGDKYDVLRSDQSVAGDHEVSADDVHRIHRVAARYYRLIVMDSGNNERAANWRAMIEHANQLVVPCTNAEETAEAGARLLDALKERDEHSAQLAENAVVLVSQRTPSKDPNVARIVDGFTPLVRKVVPIPYDPALSTGVIHFDALRPATQRAWLAAAAAVAEGL
ncbi:ParA family protein [Aeromicrobium camelliae]|nr:ParA family protein [Aeromicrobium camelliae]